MYKNRKWSKEFGWLHDVGRDGEQKKRIKCSRRVHGIMYRKHTICRLEYRIIDTFSRFLRSLSCLVVCVYISFVHLAQRFVAFPGKSNQMFFCVLERVRKPQIIHTKDSSIEIVKELCIDNDGFVGRIRRAFFLSRVCVCVRLYALFLIPLITNIHIVRW